MVHVMTVVNAIEDFTHMQNCPNTSLVCPRVFICMYTYWNSRHATQNWLKCLHVVSLCTHSQPPHSNFGLLILIRMIWKRGSDMLCCLSVSFYIISFKWSGWLTQGRNRWIRKNSESSLIVDVSWNVIAFFVSSGSGAKRGFL